MKHYQEPQSALKQKKRSWVFFPLLATFICALIIVTGCTSELSRTGNATVDQAANTIRNFTGLSDLNLKYVGIDHGYDADLYEFEADNGLFSVNTVTGRVQTFAFYRPPLPWPLASEINLDQAYEIALKYAQEKYPSLWETTDQKGVETGAPYRFDHGSGDVDYNFAWRDEYYSSNSSGGNRYTIAGPNVVEITLFSTGAVKSYHERVISIDPTLNLTPDLTENQAWKIAQDYYASHRATNVTKRADRSQELAISDDDSHIQHLTWHFVAYNNSDRGGEIWIDAHKGTVVDYLPDM
jgi:hypothetical protein